MIKNKILTGLNSAYWLWFKKAGVIIVIPIKTRGRILENCFEDYRNFVLNGFT